MQNDLSSKMAALVEQKNSTMLSYTASKYLAQYSVFWREHGHSRIQKALFHDPDPAQDQANLESAVDIYLRNTNVASGVCDAIGSQCFFVLQPLITSKATLGPVERQVIDDKRPSLLAFTRDFYQRVIAALANDHRFIDASAVLDHRTEDVFYDLGHVSAFGVPEVGAFIAEQVMARVRLAEHLGDPAPAEPQGTAKGLREATTALE